MKNPLNCILAVAALTLAAGAASAAPVLKVSGGILTGATGVMVDGTSYDVRFVDGPCTALFDGCDASSDFVFQNSGFALDASFALLSQVLVDGPAGLFNTVGGLVAGCSDTSRCVIHTPYSYSTERTLSTAYASNATQVGLLDDAGLFYSFPNDDSLTHEFADVYAVWSFTSVAAIPEPLSLALVGIGLAVMASTRRRRG